MDLTPKQQTSEAIRQAETILITTGQHPSVDQVAATIGLAMILRKFGKQVTAIITDTLPQAVQLLDTTQLERNLGGSRDFILKLDTSRAEVGGLRSEPTDGKLNIVVTPARGGFAPSDVTFDYGDSQYHFDLAIVLGVPTRARIDRIYEQNATMFASVPVVNLDFHRSNENYGAVNLIEPNASSLCEMLVALAESLQGGIIDAEIATALVMGIIASTDRFTAAHTTSKSLTVAAQMMAAGARQQAVVRALYRDGRGERNEQGGGRGNSERPNREPRNEQREAREPRENAHREPREQSHREPQRDQREAAPREQRDAQPRPVQAESQPQPQPVDVAAPVVVPAPEPAPVPVMPVPVAEADVPIIAPSHIEVSEPLAAEAPAPTPADSSPFVPSAPAPVAEPQSAASAPAAPSVADFAAAAQVQAPRSNEPQAS